MLGGVTSGGVTSGGVGGLGVVVEGDNHCLFCRTSSERRPCGRPYDAWVEYVLFRRGAIIATFWSQGGQILNGVTARKHTNEETHASIRVLRTGKLAG